MKKARSGVPDDSSVSSVSKELLIHFPSFLLRKIEATPPGMKISAATKITNRPTGAQPMPMYVAVSDSKSPRIRPPMIAPTVEPRPPRIVMTKEMSVNWPPMAG